NRSGELLADDPQPRHAAVERGRLDAEALRRATAPADPPVRAVEHGADVIDFERGQRHARRWRLGDRGPGGSHDQLVPGGEDHRTFDDVAQLADVAGPRIALQLL